MTNKAIITRRDGSAFADNAEAGALMERLGVKKKGSHGAGMLIEASDKELANLEKAGYRVKLLPETDILRIGNYAIDTDKAAPKVPKELEVPRDLADTCSQHLVQLIAPPTEEWKKAIAAEGVEVVEKVSRYGLYVVGTPEQVKGLEKLPFVVWTGPLKPAYCVAERLWKIERSGSPLKMHVRVSAERIKEVEQWIIDNGGAITRSSEKSPVNDPCRWITIELPTDHLSELANQFGVRYIDLLPETILLDERAAQIVMGDLDGALAPATGPNVGYQNNLTNLGLSGTGVNIAICDSGIDTHNNASMQADLAGRMTYFADQTGGAITVDQNGHGTHVAGIAAGNATTGNTDPGGFRLGQGIAPGSTFGSINGISGAAPLDLDGWIGVASTNGSDVMNNSWGTASGGVALFNQGYTGLCAQLDGLVRDAEAGAAGTQEAHPGLRRW
ncbi:MAG: S8 family serine peptidase [Flavobacteriales bacterium]|nr:S8 family serine peptidase [Flavobacteriales bacterium]